MIYTCNIYKGEYDLEYADIGLYQEESSPTNPVITDNVVSVGMNFKNVKSGTITADHDIGKLKLNIHQNDVDLSHDEKKRNKRTSHKMRQNGARLLHRIW